MIGTIVSMINIHFLTICIYKAPVTSNLAVTASNNKYTPLIIKSNITTLNSSQPPSLKTSESTDKNSVVKEMELNKPEITINKVIEQQANNIS